MDALIVGAGIVGAACAQELAAAGLSVGILEKSEPAFGATAAGMGHILVLDDSEAQIKLTHYARHLWHSFAPSDRTEFRTTGTLWVASNEQEMGAIERRRDFYRAYGVDAEVIARDQLYELEPVLAPGLAGGMRIPSDAVLYPPTATTELLDRAFQSGAKYFRSEIKRVGPHSVELMNGETTEATGPVRCF